MLGLYQYYIAWALATQVVYNLLNQIKQKYYNFHLKSNLVSKALNIQHRLIRRYTNLATNINSTT